MTLREFNGILRDVTPNVYHYYALTPPKTYLVWAEYEATGVYADNCRVAKQQKIWLELYTPHEFDPTLDRLEKALADEGICFDGPQTEYNEETKIILHRLDCEVMTYSQL